MTRDDLVEVLAGLPLFTDLPWHEMERITAELEETVFPAGQTLLHTGVGGGHVYVILEGEVSVLIEGTERSRLGRGEFFGEIAALIGGSPVADVVARNEPVRCVSLPRERLDEFLLDHPRVMLRMLQTEARRLHAANRWRT